MRLPAPCPIQSIDDDPRHEENAVGAAKWIHAQSWLGDKIIIRHRAREQKSKGGLIIPDFVNDKPMDGLVIAVGNGILKDGKVIMIPCRPGDWIMHKKFAGADLPVGRAMFCLLSTEDILCVCNDTMPTEIGETPTQDQDAA